MHLGFDWVSSSMEVRFARHDDIHRDGIKVWTSIEQSSGKSVGYGDVQ